MSTRMPSALSGQGWLRTRRLLMEALLYVVLAAAAVATVFPLLWMVSIAFKPEAEVLTLQPSLWPSNPKLSNLADAWRYSVFATAFVNSVLVASATTALNLLTGSMAGYAFAKKVFPGRQVLFLLVLATMMIPLPALLIPRFFIARALGWTNSYLGLIIPGSATAFSVFLMRQFIAGIPNELFEAAAIDGMPEALVYLRIVLPLSKPALAALGILAFLGAWGEFLWPLVLVNDPARYTVPLVLNSFLAEWKTQWSLLMASSLIAVTPLLIVYLVARRSIVQGIALTGLKA